MLQRPVKKNDYEDNLVNLSQGVNDMLSIQYRFCVFQVRDVHIREIGGALHIRLFQLLPELLSFESDQVVREMYNFFNYLDL